MGGHGNPGGLAASATATGCAASMGRNATAGSLGELRRTSQEETGQAPAHQVAGNATRGMMEALAEPEKEEQLSHAVGMATESAIDTAVDTLQRHGAWGGGPGEGYGRPVVGFGGDFRPGSRSA